MLDHSNLTSGRCTMYQFWLFLVKSNCNGLYPTVSTFIASVYLSTSIHWPCYCTVHVYVVIHWPCYCTVHVYVVIHWPCYCTVHVYVVIHWPCYCTVHVYVVIHFCDSFWSYWEEANMCRLCLYNVYALALDIQLSRGEGWDSINMFNPATCLCLSQTTTWISQRHISLSFCVQSIQTRWEMIVHFVDIGVIDDHHCSNLFFHKTNVFFI